ncbi:MAG: hypothetical protein IJY28_04665, partial [Clostridia bacterium]|nr:hypothetical protein [Clostridia bacterium]
MKKMHPKTDSPLIRIGVMTLVSLLCAVILLIVPAKFEYLYAEDVIPAFKLPVVLGSAAKDN